MNSLQKKKDTYKCRNASVTFENEVPNDLFSQAAADGGMNKTLQNFKTTSVIS